MVNVVDESLVTAHGYRETNIQLAKENNELKQQLSQAINDNANRGEQIYRKDVEINSLKQQLNELAAIKQKYDSIVNIVLDKAGQVAVASINREQSIQEQHHQQQQHQPQQQQQSDHQPQPESNIDQTIDSSFTTLSPTSDTISSLSDGDSGNLTSNAAGTFSIQGLNRISERSEEEEQDTGDSLLRDGSKNGANDQPDRDNTYNDSLDPPDVTSVPPFAAVERVVHTPSIWKCLDGAASNSESPNDNSNVLRITTNIQPSSPVPSQGKKQTANKLHDVYHSTPVQDNKSSSKYPSSQNSPNHDTIGSITPIAGKSGRETVIIADKSAAVNNQTRQTMVTQSKPQKTTSTSVTKSAKTTGTKRKAVQREVVFNNPDPPRYNLRKRTKV